MKWSLIIMGFLCVALGGSFSMIRTGDKKEQRPPSTFCCKKTAVQAKKDIFPSQEAEPYLPMVNILGYN